MFKRIKAYSKCNIGNWILCSERLPNAEEYLKDNGWFICTYKIIGRIFVGELHLDSFDGCWYSAFHHKRNVIAWQPLPEKYEEKGKLKGAKNEKTQSFNAS